MEYWAFDNDSIWQEEDKTIADIAIREIRYLNLIPKEVSILNSHVVRIPKCYPVYEKGYQIHLKKIEHYLNTISNLIPIGRYGAFKYNNQDHSILMGILAAKRIAFGAKADLWKVNTDTEYQEDADVDDVFGK